MWRRMGRNVLAGQADQALQAVLAFSDVVLTIPCCQITHAHRQNALRTPGTDVTTWCILGEACSTQLLFGTLGKGCNDPIDFENHVPHLRNYFSVFRLVA